METPLQKALSLLSNAEQAALCIAELEELVFECEKIDTWDLPDLTADISIGDWSSGVEEFQNLTTQQLKDLSGFNGPSFPLFNTHVDSNGTHTPWEQTKEADEFFRSALEGKKRRCRGARGPMGAAYWCHSPDRSCT